MNNTNPLKHKFELCDSMETELVCEANKLNVEPNILLDAILLAYFWQNYELIKKLYEKK